jgi:hypothetical protein
MHICARCAHIIPAPIALEIYQEAHFIASFSNMQTEELIFWFTKEWCLFHVLFQDIVK